MHKPKHKQEDLHHLIWLGFQKDDNLLLTLSQDCSNFGAEEDQFVSGRKDYWVQNPKFRIMLVGVGGEEGKENPTWVNLVSLKDKLEWQLHFTHLVVMKYSFKEKKKTSYPFLSLSS
jgi:hypothetical protein